MQKYKHNTNPGDIRYYSDDADVSKLINIDDYHLMTEEEIDRHENPEKYLSDEEKKAIARASIPDLTPIEFDMKLRKAGLLQTVRDYVATNEVMEIAYTRATFFRRTDPFIETARIELGLTEDQVDQIWTG